MSFAVRNTGTATGQCTVEIEVAGVHVTQWVSETVAPAGTASPPEVGGLGRYGSGQHQFMAYLNPGNGSADHLVNTVDIE